MYSSESGLAFVNYRQSVLIAWGPGLVFFRFTPGNAERLPFRAVHVLCKKDDLPNVLSIVRERPIECLQDRVFFAPYGNDLQQIFWLELR